MRNIKKIVSVLFSATTTSSIAIDKLHFVIGGGAGGGWDGTARGTGEALTKAGFLNGYKLCIDEKKRNIFSRQKAPTTYDHVGGFYLFKINYLKKCKNFLDGKTAGYMLPFGKNIDIDDINDFKLAKLFFEKKYYRKKNIKFYNR